MTDSEDLSTIEWRFNKFTPDEGIVVSESGPPTDTSILPSAVISNIHKLFIAAFGNSEFLYGGLDSLHKVTGQADESDKAVESFVLEALTLDHKADGVLLSYDESYILTVSNDNTRLHAYDVKCLVSEKSTKSSYTLELENPLVSVVKRPLVSNEFTLLCDNGSLYHLVIGSSTLLQLRATSSINTISWHHNGIYILAGQHIAGDELVLLDPFGKVVSHVESIKDFLRENSEISSVQWITETQFVAIYTTDEETEFETLVCNLEASSDNQFWNTSDNVICPASDELLTLSPRRFFQVLPNWASNPVMLTGFTQSSELGLILPNNTPVNYTQDGFLPALPVSIETFDERSPTCVLVDLRNDQLINAEGLESPENGQKQPVVWTIDSTGKAHGFYFYSSATCSTLRELASLAKKAATALSKPDESAKTYSKIVDVSSLELTTPIVVPQKFPAATDSKPFADVLTKDILHAEVEASSSIGADNSTELSEETSESAKKQELTADDETTASNATIETKIVDTDTSSEDKQDTSPEEAQDASITSNNTDQPNPTPSGTEHVTDSVETLAKVEVNDSHTDETVLHEVETADTTNEKETPAGEHDTTEEDADKIPDLSSDIQESIQPDDPSLMDDSSFKGFDESNLGKLSLDDKENQHDVSTLSALSTNDTSVNNTSEVSESAEASSLESSSGSGLNEDSSKVSNTELYPDPETTTQSLNQSLDEDNDDGWTDDEDANTDEKEVQPKHTLTVFGTASSSPSFTKGGTESFKSIFMANSPKNTRKYDNVKTPTGSPAPNAISTNEDTDSTPKKSDTFAPHASHNTELETSEHGENAEDNDDHDDSFIDASVEQSKESDTPSKPTSSFSAPGKTSSNDTKFSMFSSAVKNEKDGSTWSLPNSYPVNTVPSKATSSKSDLTSPDKAISSSTGLANPFGSSSSVNMAFGSSSTVNAPFGSSSSVNAPFGNIPFGSTSFSNTPFGSTTFGSTQLDGPFSKPFSKENTSDDTRKLDVKSFSHPPNKLQRPTGLEDSDSDNRVSDSYSDDESNIYEATRESVGSDAQVNASHDFSESRQDSFVDFHGDIDNTTGNFSDHVVNTLSSGLEASSLKQQESWIAADDQEEEEEKEEETEEPFDMVGHSFTVLESTWDVSNTGNQDTHQNVSELVPFVEDFLEVDVAAPGMDDIFSHTVTQFEDLINNFLVIRSLIWSEQEYGSRSVNDLHYPDSWHLRDVKSLSEITSYLETVVESVVQSNDDVSKTLEDIRSSMNTLYVKIASVEDQTALLKDISDPRTRLLRPLPLTAVQLKTKLHDHLKELLDNLAVVENNVDLIKLTLVKESGDSVSGPTLESINKSLSILGDYGKSLLKESRKTIADFEDNLPDINPSLYNKLAHIKGRKVDDSSNESMNMSSMRQESQARHSAANNRQYFNAMKNLGGILRKRVDADVLKKAEFKTAVPCGDI